MSFECDHCDRVFNTANKMEMHMKSHLPKDIPCLSARCTKKFKTHGGMMIHLEFGTCDSGCDRLSINRHAAKLYQWKKVITEGDGLLRSHLLRGDAPSRDPFQCAACGREYAKLSSLIQHVEDTNACDLKMEDPPMRQLMGWLKKTFRR